MGPSDLLRQLVVVLDRLELRYFVTGSTVTIFYGEPRFTNDIDVVVELPESKIQDFLRQFPEDQFYVSEPAARDAVRRKGQFNIIQPVSGLKVDVIVPQETPFNQSRFERARTIRAGEGFDACFASPEDAIIKKMEYYREGGSEKHLRDIAGVLNTIGDKIDLAYIALWADRMGLSEIWSMIRDRMAPRR